jgi:GTP pyrophosphokinase
MSPDTSTPPLKKSPEKQALGAKASSKAAQKPTAKAMANAAAASFAALTEKLDYLDKADIESVRLAYRFADEAHLGQLRQNGEPYITHPIAVAAQCATWKLDAQALMAALLHDAIEDCGVTKIDLIERFGSPVAELVDGLTKLEKLQFDTREENQAESFRKMLLAMARDVRVILIKLADRSHNMRTLSDMPRSKWQRISSETLDIYAPIAHRLGLNQTYRELQDLAFRHLQPWRYEILSKAVAKARNRRRDLIDAVQTAVESAFFAVNMGTQIFGREKTLYSVYRKMDKKHLSFAQVTDIYGFRVVVPTALDCYTALGLMHQLYKPVPGKFKDYIAIPKLNGYQSLHSTLVGPAGVNVEFQIRTQAMDVVAESGVAAHWLYKTNVQDAQVADRMGSKWLQSLLDIHDETRDAAEFWDHVKIDLFPDAVYVFTPKNKIMSMPRGATMVDFAYAIHSNVGDHAIGAKVNGNQVPLRTELKNGDIIEIIASPNSNPNPGWLGFVKTGRARSKIRHFLKTMAQTESIELGEKLLTQSIRAEGFQQLPAETQNDLAIWDKLLRFTGNRDKAELMSDVALGKRVASIVAKRLAQLLTDSGEKLDVLLITKERFFSPEPLSQGAITLDGSENASVKFASCCRPIPGDTILGYLGRGEGLTIHIAQCPIVRRLQHKDAERFILVEWSDEPVRNFEVGVVATVANGKGVLAKVAVTLANSESDISHVDMGTEYAQDATDLRFVISVRDHTHLDTVLKNLRRTPSVLTAERMLPTGASGSNGVAQLSGIPRE